MAAPTIDGTVGAGEWDGATVLNAAPSGAITPVVGTVSIFADTCYLYAMFDVTGDLIDPTVAYDHGEKLGININGPGNTGYPNDIMFQISYYTAAGWGGVNAGAIDGYAYTQWNIAGTDQTSLPGDLQAVTLYDTGHRVTELMIPLATIAGLSAGDTLRIGGAVDFSSAFYPYPAGMDWSIDQYGQITTTVCDTAVIPAPGAVLLGSIGVGLVSWLRRRRTL